MNIDEILEGYCWSIICDSYGNGVDSEIIWLVVGYFEAAPYQRVIGQANESEGVKGAIKDALDTVKNDSYAYQYAYKKESK